MLQLFEIDDTALLTCWFFKNVFHKTCFTVTILWISKIVAIKHNFKKGNNHEVSCG